MNGSRDATTQDLQRMLGVLASELGLGSNLPYVVSSKLLWADPSIPHARYQLNMSDNTQHTVQVTSPQSQPKMLDFGDHTVTGIADKQTPVHEETERHTPESEKQISAKKKEYETKVSGKALDFKSFRKSK